MKSGNLIKKNVQEIFLDIRLWKSASTKSVDIKSQIVNCFWNKKKEEQRVRISTYSNSYRIFWHVLVSTEGTRDKTKNYDNFELMNPFAFALPVRLLVSNKKLGPSRPDKDGIRLSLAHAHKDVQCHPHISGGHASRPGQALNPHRN